MSITLVCMLKMDFYLTKFKALLPVMAMVAMILSARAQQSGQSIIFSSPQTGGLQPGVASLRIDNSGPGILPGTMPAPVKFFDFTPPNDILPSPAPADSFQQRRTKKMLENRQNWILMTPEEILSATTADKTSQSPELDALGREKTQTELERYLDRENLLRTGATNAWQNDKASSAWNFSQDRDDVNSLDSGRTSSMDAPRNLSQFLNNGRWNQNGFVIQNGNSGWNAFGQSSALTSKPDLEQLAAMERFRQLLNPSPPETSKSSSESQFFAVPKPTADPLMMQPEFVPNPAGASFMPLNSGISRPTGLTPLPTATTSAAFPAATPIGRLQPPPWLLQGPQPFVMPQRKGF
jgi:hypothetical protein